MTELTQMIDRKKHNPFNDFNADDRDIARIYKYKLTEMEISPWFFQNSNVEIFLIIAVYGVTILLWVFRSAKMKRMRGMKKMSRVYFWATKLRLI